MKKKKIKVKYWEKNKLRDERTKKKKENSFEQKLK